MRCVAVTSLLPRWRRWWIGALVAVLLGGFTSLVVHGYLAVAAENDWRRALAETDALEPRWRLTELEADRPPIADAENAALQIILAHGKAPKLSVWGDAQEYEAIFARLKPTNQLNAQQMVWIKGQLDAAPAAIGEARKLKDFPRGCFPVRFSVDYVSTQMQKHYDALAIAELLKHDAYRLAQEDCCDEAIHNCRAILNIGRTVGDDRFLSSHLLRIVHHNIAAETAERVLAQGTPSKDSLLALQRLVAREMGDSNWTGALKGERAGWHHLFENIRNGKLERTYLRDLWRWRLSKTLTEKVTDVFADTMMKDTPDVLRFLTQRVEISKLPLHQQGAKLRELTEAATSRTPLCWLPSHCLKVHEAELRSQATLRTTLVALACERYRLEHKRWPATLDVLVAEKLLPALPIDPVNGEPLRYRQDADGIVVYSIGIDEKDDRGNIVREPLLNRPAVRSLIQANAPAEDIGFRLWNEPRRRETPLPPVVLPVR